MNWHFSYFDFYSLLQLQFTTFGCLPESRTYSYIITGPCSPVCQLCIKLIVLVTQTRRMSPQPRRDDDESTTSKIDGPPPQYRVLIRGYCLRDFHLVCFVIRQLRSIFPGKVQSVSKGVKNERRYFGLLGRNGALYEENELYNYCSASNSA